MNFDDIIKGIEEALPVLAGLEGHPELGVLGQRLIAIADQEIARRQNATGQTRTEVLADAAATFATARQANADLKALGHESEI